ncbi:hypothetical protein ACH4YN_26260 [Streptomyces griseofuscus]|uniref:hypothetical protein n=1 Tax=Streptomyces griseofuscus TaxID=146922 RepID=UPI00379EB27F
MAGAHAPDAAGFEGLRGAGAMVLGARPPGTTSFSSPPRAGPRRPSPGSPASASTGSGATRPTVETLRAELASVRPPLVLDMRNCGEREVYDLFGGYAAWGSAA